jgi:hypothetical protein
MNRMSGSATPLPEKSAPMAVQNPNHREPSVVIC